jgi:hypothetical protein
MRKFSYLDTTGTQNGHLTKNRIVFEFLTIFLTMATIFRFSCAAIILLRKQKVPALVAFVD